MDFMMVEVPRAIAESLEGINRVTTIVRAMKDFSHPDTDEKEVVDLNRAIDSTITVARNKWKYVSEVKTDFDADLPCVPCYLGEFNQVILNLITNAVDAISDVVGSSESEKGTISISSRRVDEWAEVRVTDSGSGIPLEVQPRIFDPFFTTKEVGKGTGQGLTLAHRVIVEKHKGTIRFESQPGKGTTFIIRLPLEATGRDIVQSRADQAVSA
jgi:signal transduction histidine kinase